MRQSKKYTYVSAFLIGTISASTSFAQVEPRSDQQGDKAKLPLSQLAETVEALLAADAKAALASVKASSAAAATQDATPAKPVKPVPPPPPPEDDVTVEYVRGIGTSIVAGLTVNGKAIDVRRGDTFGIQKWSVYAIQNGCVIGNRSHVAPKRVQASSLNKKVSKADTQGQVDSSATSIATVDRKWCFKDVDASLLTTPSPSQTSSLSTPALPRSTPLPTLPNSPAQTPRVVPFQPVYVSGSGSSN